MKKTFALAAIVLVLVLALTMGIVALAQGVSEDEEPVVDEPVAAAEEAAETEDEIAVEDEPAADVEDEAADVESDEAPEETAPAGEKTLVANWDVFHHRIQTWYGGEDFVSMSGKVYTLPAEISEAYGTTVEYELPPILIYESTGELDSTETLEVYYVRADGTKKSELITIEIPAGEAVYYVLEEEDGWTCTGFQIVAGSYGDEYTEIVEQ